jgi:hypothetical protein
MHIFYGTNFARWKNHMLDHFRALGPKFWWIIVVGFTLDLEENDNLTQVQEDCLTLDAQAQCYLTNALKDEIFGRVMSYTSAHGMWTALKQLYGDFSIWDDGKFKKKDNHIEMVVHECVEHDHNMVVVEDCSTSWSSDDNDGHITSSFDKVDVDATSDANDDSTLSTLDGDDGGSCSGLDDATTSPSTTPHCFMSQGDTKVSNDNVVDHVDSYDELVSRLASMTMS